MCRLLGLIANKPIDIEFSLGKFKEFAENNPDGWGIGWYENGKPKIFKEGISALNTDKIPVLSKEVASKIIIAHVRKATNGKPSHINSHPFECKNWIFAHNGRVDRDYLWALLKEEFRKRVKGETDSEVFFYYIIQCIEENKSVIDGIKKAVNKAIEKSYTGLNFLLSDGSNLYAFRYSRVNSIDYYSLFKLNRDPSNPDLWESISKETKALIKSKSLKGEKAILVCSEKLTNEKWEEIKRGNLLLIKSDLTMNEIKII